MLDTTQIEAATLYYLCKGFMRIVMDYGDQITLKDKAIFGEKPIPELFRD